MAKIVHDPGQDRLILELYAWVIVDPATQLEGIAGISVAGMPMQAVTSSPRLAELMRETVVNMAALTGKRARLVRFKKSNVMEEVL